MDRRVKFGKGLVVIAIWALGAVVLIFALSQVRDYAGIINDSGVVRGGTQRVVKMALMGESANQTEQRVTDLLAELEQHEEERLYQEPETLAFVSNLAAVKNQWRLIEDEIDKMERGEGSPEHLLSLSETHFKLADEMVLSAQRRAENDFLRTGIICTVLFLLAATIMVFMRNDRITKLKKAYFTDPLTKRKNMLAFEEQAQRLVSTAPNGAYVVVYTNISNFRYVNDAYGYEAGNQLIISLARLLEGSCKRDELVAHANADHFALLLRNEPGRPEQLCDQMEEKLRRSPDLHFTNVLSFGCGVCEANRSDGVSALMSNAIAVLKNAAEETRIAHYDATFRNAEELKIRIEQHEDRALSEREFLLYLQPKNDLADGSLVGAEALVRWESPDLGFLYPDSFIPVFEKNGFIVQLDFYMLKRVCQCYPLVAPKREDGLTVSVNFSRITILREGFVDRLLRVVDGAGVPRAAIEVEITESALVVDEDVVINKLCTLKDLGFRLAMDDFGTGYSSLNLLRKLPIDVLKIDRGFLSENSDSARSCSVLKGVVDMANDLGLTTVCEGVETKEQAAMLHRLGCRIAQGYLYSKPVPEAAFRALYDIPGAPENR